VLRGQDRWFSGDRAFSVREEFPDAWYELNNPEAVADVASRMRATLSTRREDFSPHGEELLVQQVSLFCLRQDGVVQELRVISLRHTVPGRETLATEEVRTTGGIVGTRRPSVAPWQIMVGQDPVGEWSIQLENTELVRASFKDGSIQDIVLVLTVSGLTAAWS
jgi:hypothetical protein